MEIEKLNFYLSKLEGGAYITSVSINKKDHTGVFTIKFEGDIGTIDSGEIELEFFGVSSKNISYSLLSPISIKIANHEPEVLLNVNYLEDDYQLFILEDSEKVKWWVYAKGYKAKLLSVFYGKET